MQNEIFPRWGARVAEKVISGTASKTWGLVRPELPEQGPLRWFWLNGLMNSIQDTLLLTYIPLYVLALGGTAAEIGWLSALGSLLGTAVLLPGARIAERYGQPHRMVVLVNSLVRFVILALAVWPFLGRAGVWGMIVFATLRTIGTQIALPAWTSIAASIVPGEVRGRYFASRNLVMALGAAVAVPVAGQIIDQFGGVTGYRINFGIAFVVGLAANYFYARIEAPPSQGPVIVRGKRLPLMQRLRLRPNFTLFCVHAAVWNFSLQISAPFFNVFLVQVLGASTLVVGLLATVATLSSLPGQQVWGRVADRVGPRRALLWSGLLIPLAPWAWMLVGEPWQVSFINLFSGFLWAGFNIATFNFLLAATPELRRPRYVALFNTVVGLSNAAGAALGGWIADAVSYQAIFFLSGVGRAIGLALFFFMVLDPSDAPERDLQPAPLEPGDPGYEPPAPVLAGAEADADEPSERG